MERPSPPSSRAVPGRSRPRLGQDGFTLIELVVVVVIIAIFAAMAIPQVTRQLRDRRLHEAAQRVAHTYQQARVRAMGQGGAMLVRFTEGGGATGILETREALTGPLVAVVGSTCNLLPAASCTQTDWNDPTVGQFRSIETLDVAQEPGLGEGPVGIKVFVTAQTAPAGGVAAGPTPAMDVCFTPLGRAFVRYSANTPFLPLAGVPTLQVFRGPNASTPIGLTRNVLVLPSGIARLLL